MSLPLMLSASKPYVHWIQVGVSSQLKVNIELVQDEKLLQEILDAKPKEEEVVQFKVDETIDSKKSIMLAKLKQKKGHLRKVFNNQDDESLPLTMMDKIIAIKKLIHQ